MPLSGL